MLFAKLRRTTALACRRRIPQQPLPTRRLGIAIIGQGVSAYDEPLFRNLRHTAPTSPKSSRRTDYNFFSQRQLRAPRRILFRLATGMLMEELRQSIAHLLTSVSYQAMQPMRAALLKNIQVAD